MPSDDDIYGRVAVIGSVILVLAFILVTGIASCQSNEAGTTVSLDVAGVDASAYIGTPLDTTSVSSTRLPHSLDLGYTLSFKRFPWLVRPFISYDNTLFWKGITTGVSVSRPITPHLDISFSVYHYRDLDVHHPPSPPSRPPVELPIIIDPAPVVIIDPR